MLSRDIIEVKYNIRIEARERGKLVTSRDVHNIFVDTGRGWLAQLVGYNTLPAPPTQPTEGTSAAPVDPYVNHRIRYMGAGIGGDRQHYPAGWFSVPPLNMYTATFTQSDSDPTVTNMETPVKLFPDGGVGDFWLAQVTSDIITVPNGQIKFTRIFVETDITYGGFSTMPLSEIGLYTNAADPSIEPVGAGAMVAYDTFDTIAKTNAIALQIEWTLRF